MTISGVMDTASSERGSVSWQLLPAHTGATPRAGGYSFHLLSDASAWLEAWRSEPAPMGDLRPSPAQTPFPWSQSTPGAPCPLGWGERPLLTEVVGDGFCLLASGLD